MITKQMLAEALEERNRVILSRVDAAVKEAVAAQRAHLRRRAAYKKRCIAVADQLISENLEEQKLQRQSEARGERWRNASGNLTAKVERVGGDAEFERARSVQHVALARARHGLIQQFA